MGRLQRGLILLCVIAPILLVLGSCNMLLNKAEKAEQGEAGGKPKTAGKPAAASKAPAPEAVPADQEISVNLVFAGVTPTEHSKELDFEFKAMWGEAKYETEQVQVPVSAKKGEATFDLGTAKLRIIPTIVSGAKGKYRFEVLDRGGKLIGRFDALESGKQVELASTGGGYFVKQNYFEPIKRLTGFTLAKSSDQRHPELGMIFVGKGWEAVEKNKQADMSKDYIFPEMDIVILPKAWMEENDMQESCNKLKGGTAMPAFGPGTSYTLD